MSLTISPFGIAACVLYILVTIATSAAARVAHNRQQQAWHMHRWLLLTCLFLALVVSRVFNLEEIVRFSLRQMLRANEAYDQRRELQRPLVASLVAIAAIACGRWTYSVARRIKGRRNIAVILALFGGACMMLLVVVRMISLHPIDALLYGPLKLNWIADVGLSCAVIGAAIYYIRVVLSSRQPVRGRHF